MLDDTQGRGGRFDVKVELSVIAIEVHSKSMMADYLTQRKDVDDE